MSDDRGKMTRLEAHSQQFLIGLSLKIATAHGTMHMIRIPEAAWWSRESGRDSATES